MYVCVCVSQYFLKQFCHDFYLALWFIYQGPRFLFRVPVLTFTLFNDTLIPSEYTPSNLLVLNTISKEAVLANLVITKTACRG
jgi:hypothetical protein